MCVTCDIVWRVTFRKSNFAEIRDTWINVYSYGFMRWGQIVCNCLKNTNGPFTPAEQNIYPMQMQHSWHCDISVLRLSKIWWFKLFVVPLHHFIHAKPSKKGNAAKGGSTTIGKASLTFCFWLFEITTNELVVQNNTEVNATGVVFTYIPLVCRGCIAPSRTLKWVYDIYTNGVGVTLFVYN